MSQVYIEFQSELKKPMLFNPETKKTTMKKIQTDIKQHKYIKTFISHWGTTLESPFFCTLKVF